MAPVRICFEHNDFLIVYKPAGVGFHDEKDQSVGFFNQCEALLGEKLFPVHRLDKITSGLIILARNLGTAQWFQSAFENQQIEKLYLAIGKGKPKKKQGLVKGDMQAARRSQWKLLKTQHNPAITQFFSQPLAIEKTGFRLYLLKPKTGKTHQIRVALKSISTPIMGDTLYGGFAADRGYLHAGRIWFDYKGQVVDITAPPTEGALFCEAATQCTSELLVARKLNWPRV